MKALITGINGFVGSYLKEILLKKELEVIGTDITKGENVDFSVDLLHTRKARSLISEVSPDFIFHLAAQSSVKISFEKPELTWRINVTGTDNLLNAVKLYAPKSRVLIASSADVYGIPKKLPLDENSDVNPVSPYGRSKLAQEKLAIESGLDVVVCRSFPHTGPGQSALFVCSSFAKQIAEIENGKDALIYTGNLEVKRDFTDVRDIVRAYAAAVERCESGGIYNICSEKSYEINRILGIFLTLTDKNIKIKKDPSLIRNSDIPNLTGNHSKFSKMTGWHPDIPMKTTLNDMLCYWRKKLIPEIRKQKI
ncbi:NAD-dependent epimerase/dehydratase family protein [Candidatus Woesearchaeota archaeon]|nr:NAD-dependent epimerase/dehydratase family protein [Candidatus Woesearchaeota archaeon]